MDANAIRIVVRVRPWHREKEAPFLVQKQTPNIFLGDGNFAASPRKPASSGSIREVVEVVDNRMLHFDRPETGSETRRGQPGAKRYKDRRYIFDGVLHMHATQEEVFENTAFPLLDGVLNGFNATIFAYGATGCGKTHTISGNPEDPGVIIRTMRELFNRIEESKDTYDTFLELSMVEIYNEMIRDLLNDDFPSSPLNGLKLLENEKERVTIDKVTLKRPTSVEEVMELVLLGNQRRSTSFTESNSVSSRSHAVLQINVGRNSKGHDIDLEQTVVRQCMTSATLSIIDLAGSERAAATRNMGERMKEGANINKSLLALSSCIAALCERPKRGMKPHVPFRNSKLTRMLKFSLGGNCRTVMIVCVSPSSKDIEDTHNTLVWANKAKGVTTKVIQNTAGVEMRAQQWAQALAEKQADVERLKETIKRMEQGHMEYSNNKRLLEWKVALKALENMKADMERHLQLIVEGAAVRAEWDGAELGNAALRKRMEEEGEAEKEYLASLVRQQDARYAGNNQVIGVVQREATQRSTVDALLRGLEGRKFSDALDHADLEVVRLNVAVQRAKLDQQILEAREKAHRQTVQKQGHALALAAAWICRITSRMQAQSSLLSSVTNAAVGQDALSEAISELEMLGSSGKTTLASLFGSSSHEFPTPSYSLPEADPGSSTFTLGFTTSLAPISSEFPVALPPATRQTSLAALPPAQRAALGKPQRRASTAPGDSSISFPARRMSIALGNASLSGVPRASSSVIGRRMSTAPGNSSGSFTTKASFLASPAAKRLMKDAPHKKPHTASTPGKSRLRPALVPVRAKGAAKSTPNGTPRKGIRFKSERSIDEIKEYEILTSESSGRASLPGNNEADDSADWEEHDEVPELLSLQSIRPIKPLALPRIGLPSSKLPDNPSSKTTTTPPSNASSSSSNGEGSKLNDAWRQNRAFMKGMKASMGSLSLVGEENMSIMPDSAAFNRSSLGLPPPVRPEPLGERKQLPPPTSSSSSSASTSFSGSSNLFKPTIASASRAAQSSSIGARSPDSSTYAPRTSISGLPSGARRVSNIGPMRHDPRAERQKKRDSVAPGSTALAGRDVSGGPGSASIKTLPFSHQSQGGIVPNPLAGGAKRAVPLLDQGGPSSPVKTLQRRASTMELGTVGRMGAMGSLGRGLVTRPSLSKLGQFGEGKVAPWR